MFNSYTATYNKSTEVLEPVGRISTIVSNAESLGVTQYLTTQNTTVSEKYFGLLIMKNIYPNNLKVSVESSVFNKHNRWLFSSLAL